MSLPFAEINGYRLIRQLGRPGGFGVAFEARKNGSRYVVKVFHAELLEDVDRERFRREVRAMEKVAPHPSIVPYVDSGEGGDGDRLYHYIVMPYIEGRTLRQVLDEAGGRLPLGQIRPLARQVAGALGALHEAGIVHRDVKPSNILVCVDGTAMLLDFGVARFLDYTSLTQHGQFIGTLQYAAPEQLRNETEIGTDFWALGIVIYEMLAGQRPFRGQMLELVHAILFDDPEPPSSFADGVPDELDRFVMRLLEKEPFDRPRAAGEVAAALEPHSPAVDVLTRPDPYPRNAAPMLFLRGGSEAAPLVEACVVGLNPSGIVMPITERHSVGDVRRAANEYSISYGVDPFVFRLAFPNFSSVKNLRDRVYAPADRLTPYQPDDLRALEEARRVAHGAIDEQQLGGADFFLAASFAIRDLDDKWLARNAKLLDLSLGQASAYGKPLVATLELPLEALATPEAQIRLANRLARGRPSAFLVNFDGLEAGAGPAQLYWALRLMLLLQDSGAPALLGRAGALRHFFLAFGLGGFENGLGRYVGFRMTDFNGQRKPFGSHAPRFEFPSLLEALPPDSAVAVLASGIVPEATCECRACARAGSPRDQVAGAYRHNAEMLKREGQALATLAPAERIARLEEAIAKGLLLDRELQRREIWRRRLAHLASFREAVALARPLLDVERLARRAA